MRNPVLLQVAEGVGKLAQQVRLLPLVHYNVLLLAGFQDLEQIAVKSKLKRAQVRFRRHGDPQDVDNVAVLQPELEFRLLQELILIRILRRRLQRLDCHLHLDLPTVLFRRVPLEPGVTLRARRRHSVVGQVHVAELTVADMLDGGERRSRDICFPKLLVWRLAVGGYGRERVPVRCFGTVFGRLDCGLQRLAFLLGYKQHVYVQGLQLVVAPQNARNFLLGLKRNLPLGVQRELDRLLRGQIARLYACLLK